MEWAADVKEAVIDGQRARRKLQQLMPQRQQLNLQRRLRGLYGVIRRALHRQLQQGLAIDFTVARVRQAGEFDPPLSGCM